MRYRFTLDGRSHHVTVEEHADGPVFVVDGEKFQPTVSKEGKGSYAIDIGGEVFNFQIKDGVVTEGVNQLDLEVRRAKPELVRAGGRGRKADGRIKPPMPGKVVEVNVNVGDEVAEGDILVILEAMKMQNDLKSPIAGTVSKVNVKAGENVEATTVMVEIDPPTEE